MDKCKGCMCHYHDEELGWYCVAPVCIKDYSYDPETRIYTLIDKSEWKTENPKLFEYDSKNKIVDVFVRKDDSCPFPFHSENWYHQGFYLGDFLNRLRELLKNFKGEDGKCPVCTHSTEKVYWYDSDFWGNGEATKTGECVLCGAKIYKVFKFVGIELLE